MEYVMPYGKESIPITIPDSINQIELVLPDQDTVPNPENLLLYTLEHPIQTSPLKDLLRRKNPNSVVIVIDDHTRKFPHKSILPPLLKFIENQGINRNNIIILVATGVHRRPSSDQVEYLLGSEIVDNYTIEWNDQENGEFIKFGTTSRGTPVSFNSIYVTADFKILLTDVTLHYFAGFGGDRKSIFPGVASASSINKNHSLVMNGIYPGTIKNNPIHDDMSEAAQMVGADFVVNICLDSLGEILDIKSGALTHAFLEAVSGYQQSCVVPIKEQADVLILSAGGYPFDGNYQQSMKTVMQCKNAVKFGGKILYLLKGEEGIGIPAFKDYLEEFPTSKSVFEFTQNHEYKQGMHNAYYYRKFTEEYEVFYKTSIPQRYVENVLNVKYVIDLQHTISNIIQEAHLVYIIRYGTKMMIKFDP